MPDKPVEKVAIPSDNLDEPRSATYETVRRSYPAWKVRQEQIHWPYSYYVWGTLACRLAPFFINHGIRANTVSLLALGLLFCGLLCITLGRCRYLVLRAQCLPPAHRPFA